MTEDPGGGEGSVRRRETADKPARAERLSIHVYGAKAALSFEPDENREGFPTVALDAAAAEGPKQFDWKGKIRLQLTRAELPRILAVLCGAAPGAEFKNHGEHKDKGFSVERQADRLFWKVFAREQGLRAVPMGPEDAFYVAALFLRQLQKGAPWLAGQDLIALAERIFAPRASG